MKTFIRSLSGSWINVDHVEVIKIDHDDLSWHENSENAKSRFIVIVVTRSGDEFHWARFVTREEAQNRLDNYMQWSVNGG
jgi:hypothetical protein